MKIAIDNQISCNTITQLRMAKHTICVLANDKDDYDWIQEAIDAEVDVIISPDLDVPNMLDRMDSDIRWLEIPQNLKSKDQFNYIMKRL